MQKNKENLVSWMLMADYLKNNLNTVKQSLGNKCTFLSFLTSKEYDTKTESYRPFTAYYAIMKNNLGGRDKVTLKLDKPYSELQVNDFRELAGYLGRAEYEKDGRSTVAV